MQSLRHASGGSGEARGARLSVSLSGTNLVRAADYNQRTVLQAIRLSGETTRLELARQTGLTAATIANITGRLIELGLVSLAGRYQGARGQPALRLTIDPDGAFAIGLNIDRDHVTMVTLDLAGEVRSRVSCEMAFALPEDVLAYVRDQLDGLIEAGGIQRERVLGVGVALPDELGAIALPHRPDRYDEWSQLNVAQLLGDVLPWPVLVDNDAAAAALGEAQCTGFENASFFYLLISAGLGGGPVIDGSYYRGATARSGEIGLMPDPTAQTQGALVQDTVSLSALTARLEAAGQPFAELEDLISTDPATLAVVDLWLGDATRTLIAPLVAVNCLINPGAVLIGGRLPLPLIERLSVSLNTALGQLMLPSLAQVAPATMAGDAPAIGAAVLPFLDQLLPSDAILIQAGRG
ncbi:ROK family transcriptional regulator [Novosphingobium terrae]|uniref:ROK family transcriptional regulator n=1 Tax=Novosphingobium terrae TaxID=2726189 RepID=UPI001F130236|nr:ROK family transcriptional regulator [Novosphingobium terrae]